MSTEQRTQEVVQAFWEGMNSNDFVATARLLSNDFECRMPQSGEVIKGPQNFAAFNAAYPAKGPWRFTVNRCVSEGNTAVTDVSVTDGDLKATVITFHTVAKGLITRQVEYWPDPFPAQAWRAHLVSELKGIAHDT
ncbi:nuclear transport factor 2 family protein [Planktotalea sp.]|uniref:nuclear transport factor 2 family protein n=1 Tax=Planktotalea sp. TaxID=2029877 RepID=UPI003298287D